MTTVCRVLSYNRMVHRAVVEAFSVFILRPLVRLFLGVVRLYWRKKIPLYILTCAFFIDELAKAMPDTDVIACS